MKLLIATTNTHKVRELRALLKPLQKFDIFTLLDFPSYTPNPEEGESFQEIAQQKALHAASVLNVFAIADDSGLVVPALNGAPGIYSARYAKPDATDKENRQKLLKEMSRLSDGERFAYFECAIAIASPKKVLKCVQGIAEGVISDKERGGHGFGYDPLFIKHDYNQTFAELSEEVKNKVSHRGKALQKLLLFLETL